MIVDGVVDALIAAVILAFVVCVVVAIGRAVMSSHEPTEKEPWDKPQPLDDEEHL